MLGQTIGRYQIIEQLGEGGMSTVYKAFDTHLETYVALKVIRQDWVTLDNASKLLVRFEAEAKRVARLSHPNIIPILDYGKYQNVPFLVMKYIPGGTLKKRLGAPMPWYDAVRLILPIARALSYAHQQGIIHRDVKPANILLTESGEPMLSDFGIAKMLMSEDKPSSLTGTSIVLGTPEYMAPEQAIGRTIDHRVDVYALGLVLYEMITGRMPFTADTPMAIIMKHISDPLPDPRQFIPQLPDPLERILFRALAKAPEDRFASMAEFCAALENTTHLPTWAARQPAGQQQPVSSGPPAEAGVPKATTPGPQRPFTPDAGAPPVQAASPRSSQPMPTVGTPSAPGRSPSQSQPGMRSGSSGASGSGSNPAMAPAAAPAHPAAKPRLRTSLLIFIAGGFAVVLLCLLASGGLVFLASLAPTDTPTGIVAAAQAASQAGTVTPTVSQLTLLSTTPTPEKAAQPPAPHTIVTELVLATPTPSTQETTSAQNMYETVLNMYTQGEISSISGSYHNVKDFDESWAQLGWYQWWKTGYQPANFVIRAHTTWESASKTADWYNAGCGFVFRAKDKDNHYLIYLGLDGNVYLKSYLGGAQRELGKESAGSVNHMKGEADVMLVADGSRLAYYLNGSKIFERSDSTLPKGDLALTLVSGTNQDFGTRCTMTKVELWEFSGQ